MSRWKDVAEKAIKSERVDLTTLIPDQATIEEWKANGKPWVTYWMRSKLYGIDGKDRVDATMFKNSIQSHIPVEVKIRMADIYEQNKDMKEEDLFKALSAEDKEAIMEAQTAADVNNAVIVKRIIIEGLDENNILDPDETVEEFADVIVKYPNQAAEIVRNIRNHNRPLAQDTSVKSDTPPEMSSQVPDTGKTRKHSRTEPTPPEL